MATTRQPQRGMTLVGWLIVIVLVMYFALLAIRLIPIYYESFAVDRALEQVANEPTISAGDRREIQNQLRKQFEISNIESADADALTFESRDGGVEIILDYEARTTFWANISLVVDFRKSATVAR